MSAPSDVDGLLTGVSVHWCGAAVQALNVAEPTSFAPLFGRLRQALAVDPAGSWCLVNWAVESRSIGVQC